MFIFIRILILIITLISLNACSINQTKQLSHPNKNHQLSTHNSEFTTDNQTTGEQIIQEHKGMNGQLDSTVSPTTGSVHLPFDDFKDRWNAVTQDQMSNLYIETLEEVQTNGNTIYRAHLNSQIELSIFMANGYVQSLEMDSTGNSRENIYTMLSGWSQMITILHPEMEIHDVDSIFNQIGIGPNGDLTNMRENSFTYSDLQYRVSIIDNVYTLKISYE